MKNTTFKQSNYTTKCNTSQLVLPLGFSLILKEDDPIFSFNSIMDKVSLLDLEQEVNIKGRNPYDFRMMCKLVSFSYMEGNWYFFLTQYHFLMKQKMNVNLNCLKISHIPEPKRNKKKKLISN